LLMIKMHVPIDPSHEKSVVKINACLIQLLHLSISVNTRSNEPGKPERA
jgi:hypothetical protein